MNKDSNYYRKRLNIETIILLSITFFFFILRFITLTSYPKDIQMVYLLCLFVYLMLLIILLCNYKEKKKFIGTLSIVVGLLMTILIFINRSLTSILYLIFSVIYIFSSIKYLQALKKENIKDDTKETKISIILVILGLFLNILCIILIYDLPSSLVIIKLILCGLFAIGAPALILISIKHRKGTIKYLILSVSILFSIMCLAILPRNIKYDIARNKIEEENNKTYLHSGCFDYTIDGVITKYTCEDKHIIIPSEIEETIITKVNAKFMNSFESIEIPSTIDEMNFDNIIYYSSIEKMRIINHSQKLKFDLSILKQ